MPPHKHVTLRIDATDHGVAAELLQILEEVTADGIITEDEVRALRAWLDSHDSQELAFTFLRTILESVLAGGTMSPASLATLQRAIERVLPADLREKAQATRVAHELLEKTKRKEEVDPISWAKFRPFLDGAAG